MSEEEKQLFITIIKQNALIIDQNEYLIEFMSNKKDTLYGRYLLGRTKEIRDNVEKIFQDDLQMKLNKL